MKRIKTGCLLLAALLTLGTAAGCGGSASSKTAGSTAAPAMSVAAAAPADTNWEAAPMEQPGYNTEEYGAISENRFLSVAASPLSTFAADVDTASYANIRRFLRDGMLPPPDAVRIEEMVNYFSYDYPEPEDGAPFSVSTELAPCPWNPDTVLLSIGLAAPPVDTRELPAQNLVFLLDVSGSMDSPDKLPLLQRSFLLLCEELNPQDRVSIVTYASQDQVVIDGATGDEKAEIMAAIENLTAGGSTAGAAGIETAYHLAEKHFLKDGNNRIILATDGDLNVGVTSEGDLKRLVEQKRESGVFLSVLGFGTENIKDNKMETLADNGNGNYAYIDDIAEARRVLVGELGATLLTVAKDVKLQVEFNPAAIKGYRLVGYENRLLNAEDFEDDSKDGGEIGAGHRVTALYELVEIDSDFPVETPDRKYADSTAAGRAPAGEWLTVNVRYKAPDGDESQLISRPVEGTLAPAMSENLTLASAVAQAGMLLRESDYAGTASYASILRQLNDFPRLQDDPYAKEFYRFVRQLDEMTAKGD